MKCLILAGGFATRLWPLTEARAKPLLLLRDRPLISHLAEGLPHDLPVIVSTNAAFEADFKAWAAGYPGRDIRIFVEDAASEDYKKGALGATALVIGQLGIKEDLLLLAGDNYFGFKFADFLAAYKGNPLLAAYDVGERERAKKFGVVVEKEGRVAAFQEKPAEPQSTLVSTGGYVFPARNLADITHHAREKKDDLGGVFEYLLSKGETIDVFRFKEPWYDIGSFEAYLDANRALTGDQVLQAGGVKETGHNVYRGSVYLGKDVTVRDSELENTVVMKDCFIENCVIRDCVIDEGCTLRNLDLSHQMIRAGSLLERHHG